MAYRCRQRRRLCPIAGEGAAVSRAGEGDAGGACRRKNGRVRCRGPASGVGCRGRERAEGVEATSEVQAGGRERCAQISWDAGRLGERRRPKGRRDLTLGF